MANLDNVTITIKKDKVYSSYYARACRIVPDSRLVAISIGIPDKFNGNILRELNPPSKLLYDYKNGKCTKEEYTKIYFTEVLDNLDATEIYNKIKGKVILCYCGKDTFCHRHLVMDWLKQELGEQIVGGEI